MSEKHIMNAKILTKYLKQTVATAESVHQEAVVEFSPEGLEIRIDDPAGTAYAFIEIDINAFDNFEASEGSFGIDIPDLSKSLKYIDDDDITELNLTDDRSSLIIHGSGQKSTLKPIATQHVECDIPELDVNYSAEVTVPGSEFTQAIKAANEFSDQLIFYIQEDKAELRLRGEGDLNETERVLGDDLLEDIQVGPAYNVYSLDYLTSLANAIEDDVLVHLKLAEEERPMEISFEITGGDGSVEYVLAPYIGSD